MPDQTDFETNTYVEDAAGVLAHIREKIPTLDLEPEDFDLDLLEEQLDLLEARFATSQIGEAVSIIDMQLALSEILQGQMGRIVEDSIMAEDGGTDTSSLRSKTASMIAAMDKAINNARVVFNGWNNPQDDTKWKDLAKGKTPTDIIRKEMIYTMSMIDSTGKLGQALGSSSALYEDSPEQGALIAQFALDALKTATRALQLNDVRLHQNIAFASFDELSALDIGDHDLTEKLNDYLARVSDGDGTLKLPTTGEAGTESKYADYKATIKALLSDMEKTIEALRGAEAAASNELQGTWDAISEKNQERAELQTELEAAKAREAEIANRPAPDNPEDAAEAQQQAKEAAEAREQLEEKITEVNTEIESLRDKETVHEADIQRLNASIAEHEAIEAKATATKAAFDHASSQAGITDGALKLLSLGSTISGMIANGVSGANDTVGYVAGGISMATDLSDLASALAKYKAAKNYESGAGAVGGVLGVGPQLATFAQSIINLKDAPDDQKGYYIAEAVVQGVNMAMGLAIGALTSSAAIAGTAVSSAVPVLGVLASLASAVNPLQWSSFAQMNDHIDDVRDKTDIESDAYETSAAMLAQLLETSRNIEVGFYVAETVVGVAGGVGASAAAATGVGAPVALAIAGVTATLQGVLAATKQAALNKAAENIADKIRAFDGGVEGFFDQSFDLQSDRELADFLESAQALIDGGFDSVAALGSVQMTGSDLELAGLSGIGGELARTQDHFAGYLESDDLETGDWDREQIYFESGTIVLGDKDEAATQKQKMLQFISPLAAAGEEDLDRHKTGKKSYETTLEIKDLTGWRLVDGGDSTTFDLRNVVTKARDSADAALKDITMMVEGHAGDDMFLMTETTGSSSKTSGTPNIDGGEGQDTVTYANLTHLVEGLHVFVNAAGNLLVKKVIDADTSILEGAIGSATVQRGKESERVEYSYIDQKEIGQTTVLYDELKSIEMIAASEQDDQITVAVYNEALVVAGLGGDDFIKLGQGHGALGGEGDDTFLPAKSLKTVGETESDLPEVVEISGGDGYDTILLQENWGQTLFEMGALYLFAEQILADDDELLDALMPASLASELGEDIAVATIANRLSKDGWAMTSILAFEGIENVTWDLQGMIEVVYGAAADLNGKLNLGEFADAAQTILNRSTIGDYTGLITYDASGLEATATENGQQIGYAIKGTTRAEGIIGSAFADLLFAGDGDDWLDGGAGTNVLTGADGADTFHFDMALQSDTTVNLVNFNLDGTEPDYGDQTAGDRFEFDLTGISATELTFSQTGESGYDLKVQSNSATVLIEDYFTDAYALLADGPILSFSSRIGEVELDYADILPFLDLETGTELQLNRTGDLHTLAGVRVDQFKGDLTTIISGDFNGDGKDDFIRQEKGSWDNDSKNTANMFLATGGGQFRRAGEINKLAGVGGDTFKGDLTNILVGDFNGDGKDDMIRQEKGGWDDDSNNTANLFLATENGRFQKAGELNQLAGRADVFKGDLTNIIIGDFNGDGRDDLIKQEKDYWDDDDQNTAQLFLSQENGTFKLRGNLNGLTEQDGDPFKGDETNLIAGDFNGDGIDDFIRQDRTGGADFRMTTEVYQGAGDGTFTLLGDLDDLTGTSGNPFRGDETTITVADVDGNGRDDLIIQDDGREIEVYLSQALTGGFAHGGSFDAHFPRDGTRLIAGDYDDDGNTDIIRQEYAALDDNNINTANLYEFSLV